MRYKTYALNVNTTFANFAWYCPIFVILFYHEDSWSQLLGIELDYLLHLLYPLKNKSIFKFVHNRLSWTSFTLAPLAHPHFLFLICSSYVIFWYIASIPILRSKILLFIFASNTWYCMNPSQHHHTCCIIFCICTFLCFLAMVVKWLRWS